MTIKLSPQEIEHELKQISDTPEIILCLDILEEKKIEPYSFLLFSMFQKLIFKNYYTTFKTK